MKFDPSVTPLDRWKNDELQFMRLLGEFAQSTDRFTQEQMTTLCDTMGLLPGDLNDLLDRASDAWDAYKATVPALTYRLVAIDNCKQAKKQEGLTVTHTYNVKARRRSR